MRSLPLLAALLAVLATPSASSELPEGWVRINALAIDPSDPRVLYLDILAESRGGGLFKSTDGGASWQALPKKPGGPGSNRLSDSPGLVVSLAVSPFKAGTLFAATLAGLFKSTNGGLEWAPLQGPGDLPGARGSSGLNSLMVQFDPPGRTTLYAWTDEGLFRSTDEGHGWTRLRAGPTEDEFGFEADVLDVSILARDPGSSGALYALGHAGLYASRDSGSTWRRLGDGPVMEETNSSFFALAIDPHSPRVLWVSTEEGLFRSADGGATWSRREVGHEGMVSLLAFEPGSSTVLYAGAGEALLRSDDSGASWRRIGPDEQAGFAFDPRNPATIYLLTRTGLFKSTDRGTTWAPASRGLPVLTTDAKEPARRP